MSCAEADAVLAVVFTDAIVDPADLPYSTLVEELQHAVDVPMKDALLVSGERVWSYLCPLPECCPPEGRLVDRTSAAATALAAADVVSGRAVLADREEMVRSAQALGGVTEVSMLQAIERWADGDGATVGQLRDTYRTVLDVALQRYATLPAELSHDEAALLALCWHDHGLRDEMLGLASEHDAAAEELIRDVARLVPSPFDAPAATMLAWVAYVAGCGVVAGAALDRALTTDSGYSLACLLDDALARQVPPSALREVWTKFADDGRPRRRPGGRGRRTRG
jgi:hypothetical protein